MTRWNIREALLISLATSVCACGSDFDPPVETKADAGQEASTGGAGGSVGGSGGTVTGGSGGSTSGGSAGTSGSGGDAGPTCPTGHRCVAPAPSGWTGPVLRSTSTCGGSWAQLGLTLHEGLTAGAATCECNCTPDVTCPTSLQWNNYAGLACTSASGSSSMAPGACKAKTALSHGASMAAATPTCGAVVDETIPAISWTTDDTLCTGATEGGTCETAGELCLPEENGTLCIYRTGDEACPSDYPTKIQAYSGATDTRDCPQSCTCTPSGTATCTANVFTFAGAQCTAAPLGSVNVTSGVTTPVCLGSSAGAAQAGTITKGTLGTCTGQNPTPTGSAAPSGEHTLCCTP